MLLNVPRVLTPELLAALDRMGHGDEIVISDANYPAETMARECTCTAPIYLKGAGVPEVLDAVLTMIPLDYLTEQSVIGVQAPPERGPQPIHDEYPKVLAKHGYGPERLGMLSKADFYARARNAYCVVVTGEAATFANMIVRKGVVK